MLSSERGQSLVEVVVVIAVVAIVVGGLVFATIASIRNATLAKNQAQATKYAQEGLEQVRAARDRMDSNTINGLILGGQSVTDWTDADLWGNQITASCDPCYFKLTSPLGVLQYQGITRSSPETIGVFSRSIILSDSSATCTTDTGTASCYSVEKQVTAIVVWTDFLQKTHQSQLTTILRKL